MRENAPPESDSDPDPAVLLEREFERRALASERLRLLVIAIGATFPMLGAIVVPIVAPEIPRLVFHGKLDARLGFAGGIAIIGYALASRHALGRMQAAGRVPGTLVRYAVAWVEITLPSVIVMGLFSVFDPVLALFTPPTFLYATFIVLSALRLDPALSLFTGAVAALEYVGLSAYALSHTHLVTPDPMLVAPFHHAGKAAVLLLTGAATALASRSIRAGLVDSIERLHERNRIIDVFGKHVSPQVVNKLLAQPKEMVSEVRHVCVMFLDVRGFTGFSEGKSPEDVVEFLNGLFGFMIDEISERGGIINKFLGDGFMAVFGAPVSTGADSRSAVEASLAILRRVHALASDGSLPETRIGIALHAGEVITGHVGSRRRREYTVIGDVVNVASRLEGMNKEYGSEFLVSGAVVAEVPATGAKVTSLGTVPVRGRDSTLEIFRIDPTDEVDGPAPRE